MHVIQNCGLINPVKIELIQPSALLNKLASFKAKKITFNLNQCRKCFNVSMARYEGIYRSLSRWVFNIQDDLCRERLLYVILDGNIEYLKNHKFHRSWWGIVRSLDRLPKEILSNLYVLTATTPKRHISAHLERYMTSLSFSLPQVMNCKLQD